MFTKQTHEVHMYTHVCMWIFHVNMAGGGAINIIIIAQKPGPVIVEIEKGMFQGFISKDNKATLKIFLRKDTDRVKYSSINSVLC